MSAGGDFCRGFLQYVGDSRAVRGPFGPDSRMWCSFCSRVQLLCPRVAASEKAMRPRYYLRVLRRSFAASSRRVHSLLPCLCRHPGLPLIFHRRPPPPGQVDTLRASSGPKLSLAHPNCSRFAARAAGHPCRRPPRVYCGQEAHRSSGCVDRI